MPSPLRTALLALAALSLGCATTQRSDGPSWTDVEDPSVERPTTKAPGEVDPVAASEAKAEEEARRPALMSFPEIMQVIEDSERLYEIVEGPPGPHTDAMWPREEPPSGEFHVVTGASGEQRLEPLPPLPKESLQRLEAAESAFRKRRFKEAAEGYRALLKLHPEHFPLYLTLGDTQLFTGDPEGARVSYERAAELSPLSYAPWFFRASALLRLGQPEDAAKSYARALSLRPAWPNLVAALEANGRHIGRAIQPRMLAPQAKVFRKGDAIVVEVNPKRRAWLNYALCKAMWLGEPELREERLAQVEGFTVLEEAECVSNLLVAHRMLRDEEPDADLDRALQVAEDGYLSELVLYEIVSRQNPMLIPMLSDEARARVETFVNRYVLAPVKGDTRRATDEG